MTRLKLRVALAASLAAPFLAAITGSDARAAGTVDSEQLMQARAFLAQYSSLSHAQSPQFFNLYSDRAVVHTRVEGEENGLDFQGRAYKQWSRELLQTRRVVIDSSEFHEARVEQRGERLVIQAKRFSDSRCYWDVKYRVSLAKEGATYRIVDERLTTTRQRRCEPMASAAPSPADSMTLTPTDNGKWGPTPGRPEWHPLSQVAITQAAMRLAQAAAAKNALQMQGSSNQVTHVPQIKVPNPPTNSDPLWVTPEATQ